MNDVKLKSEEERLAFNSKIDRSGGDDACWIWKQGTNSDGYGQFKLRGKSILAHRVMYVEVFGSIPEDKPFVCHSCDNPPCCNPKHFFAGTKKDNALDRELKGRGNQPSGDKSGARLHPECLPRGDNHWAKRHPEKYRRGDDHHSRKNPSCMPRGDRSGRRLHPERYPVGEKHHKAKLREFEILEIFEMRKKLINLSLIAEKFHVSRSSIEKIVYGRYWKHVKKPEEIP